MIFGAQRFATSSGLGVPPSGMQSGVADSLGWVSGELPILPSLDRSRRRLLGESRNLESDNSPRMPIELVQLLNNLCTCASTSLLSLLVRRSMRMCHSAEPTHQPRTSHDNSPPPLYQ